MKILTKFLWVLAVAAPCLSPGLALAGEEKPEAALAAIFEDNCTGCHSEDDDFPLEALSLQQLAAHQSSDGRPMVVPGKPNESYLMQKLVGAPGIDGDPMPLDEDPLSQEQLAMVSDWIRSLAEETQPVVQAGVTPNVPTQTGPSTTEAEVGSSTPESAQDLSPVANAEGTVSTSAEASEAKAPVPSTSTGVDEVAPRRKKVRNNFNGTHQINLQTTTTLGKKVLSFRIHHRFGRFGRLIKDRSYFGLAGGAIMSMAVGYGITDRWDALLRWTNSNLDWELGTKYVPIRQEDGAPVSFGGFGSFEVLTSDPAVNENPFTGNFRTFVSRLWWDRWSTQLTLGYSLFTNHAETVQVDQGNGPERVRDRRGTLNVGLASTLWLDKKGKYGVDLEYVLPIPDGGTPNLFYYRGGDADPNGPSIGSWALGFSARAGLHFFQVFMTNTRNIHTNLAAPGGDTSNPFSPLGDFFLGFNITRKWKL